MKIKIKPVQVFVSNKGMMTASQVDVRVQNYDLGVSVKCAYDLQWVDEANPKAPRMENLASGQKDLTPEQFAQWAADDTFVAKSTVLNLGLVPAE